MGKLFKSGKTKVKYSYPPEATATIQQLQKYAGQLEQLMPQIEPQLKNIYGDLFSQISTWMSEYPTELAKLMERGDVWETADLARRRLQDIETQGRRDIWETADTAKARTREEIGKVKEDVLRNLYRDLGMRGLISSSAGVSAITEQMRKTELEPILDIERTAYQQELGRRKALLDAHLGVEQTAYQQELGRRLGLMAEYLDFFKNKPELFESMAKLRETQTMVPWVLRERIMGSLSGVGQLAGQLAQPVVKTSSPGIFSQLFSFLTPFAFAKWLRF